MNKNKLIAIGIVAGVIAIFLIVVSFRVFKEINSAVATPKPGLGQEKEAETATPQVDQNSHSATTIMASSDLLDPARLAKKKHPIESAKPAAEESPQRIYEIPLEQTILLQ